MQFSRRPILTMRWWWTETYHSFYFLILNHCPANPSPQLGSLLTIPALQCYAYKPPSNSEMTFMSCQFLLICGSVETHLFLHTESGRLLSRGITLADDISRSCGLVEARQAEFSQESFSKTPPTNCYDPRKCASDYNLPRWLKCRLRKNVSKDIRCQMSKSQCTFKCASHVLLSIIECPCVIERIPE